MNMRVIVHVDVDAFFPSVEQLLIPALRGRPVIVGSGCIASCSYEARQFGLHAGMPLREAMRLCPQAVRLAGRYQTYRCFAEHIWEICRRYATSLETYLDEAYGDVSGCDARGANPAALGRRLQQDVRDEAHLPVSVGLGANRMMAKIASAHGKPGGAVWIAPGAEDPLLAGLPVARLPGVGPKTGQVLTDMNVRTVADLRALSRPTLAAMFGRRGELLYERCRGRDCEPLRPEALPKSISRETTFHKPEQDPAKVHGMLHYLLERAMRAMRRDGLMARTVELSIRYDDWKHRAAARSLTEPTDNDDAMLQVVLELFGRLHNRRVAIRHVGVVLSGFSPAGANTTLFEHARAAKEHDVCQAVDAIRDRWGHGAIVTGKSIALLGELQQDDYGFILRTTSLTK
jgi:DNA polymerase-4